MSKMNPVVHFELPADDKKRIAEFYSKSFGWEMQFLGPEMSEYVVATTAESDETGRPKTGGVINGGFYQKTEDPNTHHPSVVIGVEDIKESIRKVKEAGGMILGEAQEIPGIGKYVSFIDTEGNRLSMLQPKMN
ncbi:MAG: VOC family protein [Calditrichaceae bacterium]|jgi:uncharacterized protein